MNKRKQHRRRAATPLNPAPSAKDTSLLHVHPSERVRSLFRCRHVPVWLAIMTAVMLAAEIFLPTQNPLADQRIGLANYLVTRQVQIAQMAERLQENDFLPYIALTEQRNVDSLWLKAVDGYTLNLHTFLRIVDSPLDGVVANALVPQLEDLQHVTNLSESCLAATKLAAESATRATIGIANARELSNQLQTIRQRATSESLKSGDPVETAKLAASIYGDRDLKPLFGGDDGQGDPRTALSTILERRGTMIESIGATIDACRDSYDDASDEANSLSRYIKLSLICVSLCLQWLMAHRYPQQQTG